MAGDDVLELPRAQVLERQGDLVAHVAVHVLRDRDAAGLGERLHTRRHIHPVAEDIGAVDDHVADVDANAEVEALVGRQFLIALPKRVLDVDRRRERLDHPRKIGEHAVTASLHDSAIVACDQAVDVASIGP